MKKIILIFCLLPSLAFGAVFQSSEVNMHGWNFKYELTIDKSMDIKYWNTAKTFKIPYQVFIPVCAGGLKYPQCSISAATARTLADKKAVKQEKNIIAGHS